jgi:hypothetical protein
MATITLDYNTRNRQARKALDYIISTGVFKTHTNSTTITKASQPAKQKRIEKLFAPYLIDLSDYKFNRDEANNYD